MSLIADVITILKSSSSVNSLCLTNPKTGQKAIRPDRLSQTDSLTTSRGGILVRSDGREIQNDLSGSSKTSWVKITVGCVCPSRAVAAAIADAVESVMEPFRGATSTGSIDGIELDDRREDWFPQDDGADNGEYVIEVDLNVFYTRN